METLNAKISLEITEIQQAISTWMKNKYNVDVKPESITFESDYEGEIISVSMFVPVGGKAGEKALREFDNDGVYLSSRSS